MISVCIATYNGAKYLKNQLTSILCQLDSNDEIVISDDNSTDGSIDIAKSLNDDRIHVFKFIQPKEGRRPIELCTKNFENALKNSRGDIIFLSDQDDVWLPHKVEVMMTYLQQYDYVVSDCYITDHNLHITANTRFNGTFTKNKYLALFKPTPYQGSCVAFKRKVLLKSLPFPNEIQSHDRWIGYIASFFFSHIIIDEPLIYYRRHGNNTSCFTFHKPNSYLYRIKTRLVYVYELFRILLKDNFLL